jgi:hypothetical protein
VEALEASQVEAMKTTYLDLHRKYEYPFDKFRNVVFELDSDENVHVNYCGNYFFRLR